MLSPWNDLRRGYHVPTLLKTTGAIRLMESAIELWVVLFPWNDLGDVENNGSRSDGIAHSPINIV